MSGTSTAPASAQSPIDAALAAAARQADAQLAEHVAVEAQLTAELTAAQQAAAAASAALDAERAAHAGTRDELTAAQDRIAALSAPPLAPPVAPDQPAATGTLTVGWRGASALTIYLNDQRVTLAGGKSAGNVAGYGQTAGVPAAAFEAWLSDNAESPIVRDGNLIVLSRQPE